MPETKTTGDDVIEDILTAPRQEQAVATVERPGELAASSAQPGVVASAILELAKDPSFDVEKLRALKDMQNEMEDRDAVRSFRRDMALAQAECQAVVRRNEAKMITKDGENKGSWTFADLNDIDIMLRPIRTKYGFSITHDRKRTEGGLECISTLHHRDGHSITASFPLALDAGAGKNNLQAAGSTDSYGRKYNTLGFFDVVRKGQDNDGAAMSGGETLRGLPGDEGMKKAARLKELADESGILAHAENQLDRQAATAGWLADGVLSYTISSWRDIRQEDYNRVVRLLRIEGDKYKARMEREAKI